MLWSMRSQRVGYDWATVLNWNNFPYLLYHFYIPISHIWTTFSPHSHRHFMIPVFFIMDILVGVKYYHIVGLIYSYLMTNAEKAMAPHSSTLAWKIPWTEEPGGLQSMGSLRVGHDWATSLSLFTFMHWRRKWQPTPVFLPAESQGRGSLVGCRLWGHTESDILKWLSSSSSSSND